MSDHHPQPDIVVAIVRMVVVAIRTARVPLIIVPRAAPQHAAVLWPAPAETVLLNATVICLPRHPEPSLRVAKGLGLAPLAEILRRAAAQNDRLNDDF